MLGRLAPRGHTEISTRLAGRGMSRRRSLRRQKGTGVDNPPSATKASKPFWTRPLDAVLAELTSTAQGLSASEAAGRLVTYGPNTDTPPRKTSLLAAVARRFLEPLILLLLFAAAVSAATGDATSAGIIAAIILVSVALDAVQEGRAAKAADALKQSVALKAEVKRDGQFVSLPTADVVPGDVFRVRTGDVIPADALVLEVSSFSANEAALTGEP
jgi:Mg2+-importing ATPase